MDAALRTSFYYCSRCISKKAVLQLADISNSGLQIFLKSESSWNEDSDFWRFQHSNTYCLRIADFIEDEIEGTVEYPS